MKYQWHPNEVLLPADVAGLQMDSIVLCYQIRTLDKSRLEEDVGELIDAELRQEVVEALRFQLDV
jgi:mRNA interferase MazF